MVSSFGEFVFTYIGITSVNYFEDLVVVAQVTNSCLTFCDPINCSTHFFTSLSFTISWSVRSFLSFAISWSVFKLMSIESVMQSNHCILCHALLLLNSIFLRIWVFSNESVLCIRWWKYWNLSFSINFSNEYSGLISFRTDWFNLLVV